jgi:hypothetical protein
MVAQRETPRLCSLRLPSGQKRGVHDTSGRDSAAQNHALADERRWLPRLVPERPLNPVPEPHGWCSLVDHLARASERRESPLHHDDRWRSHMGKRVFLAGWPADRGRPGRVDLCVEQARRHLANHHGVGCGRGPRLGLETGIRTRSGQRLQPGGSHVASSLGCPGGSTSSYP